MATPGQIAELDQLGKALLDVAYEEAIFLPKIKMAKELVEQHKDPTEAEVRDTIESLGGVHGVMKLMLKSMDLQSRRQSALDVYVAVRRAVEGA